MSDGCTTAWLIQSFRHLFKPNYKMANVVYCGYSAPSYFKLNNLYFFGLYYGLKD